MRRFTFLSVLAVLVLGLSVITLAQSDTARIVGTVTDASGAAVPGVTITVKSPATARTLSVQTGATGNYAVSTLTPGAYHVEVKMANFKTSTADITLEVSQVQELNFKLQPGAVETTVNVTDEVPLVETSTSTTGEVIQGRQVTELPLNGRNFTQLALLTPGVTRGQYGDVSMGGSSGTNSEAFRNSDTGGASLSANGLRAQANTFLLDGVDNNEALVNSIVFFPPAEAIQEFRVNTTVAPAEFGKAGGAVVQVASKSGSNQIHGSAFEFRRTDVMDATPWGSTSKPSFKRNQFGGTLGGAIWKNKLFAFIDYQGLRQSQPQNVEFATVPTAKMRNGDFSELLGTNLPTIPSASICPNLYDTGDGISRLSANKGGASAVLPQYAGKGYIYNPMTCQPFGWNGTTGTNIIPANMLNKAAVNYLNAFPLPNVTTAGVITQNFRAQRQQIRNYDDYDARLDFMATQKDSVFVRFSYGQDKFSVTDRLKDNTHDLPSGFGSGDNFNHPRGVAVGYTHSFNGNLTNEFHWEWLRPFFGYNPPMASVPLAANLGIVNANRNSLLGGIALIGGWNNEIEYTGDYGPYSVPQKAYQFSDAVTYNKGRHTWKFGTSILERRVDFAQGNAAKGYFYIGDGTGMFTGYEVSELLSGFVQRYDIGDLNGYYKTKNWETGYYAQDDFRVNSKLTLNLGLRYDLYTWPTEDHNKQSNFDPVSGKLIEPGTPGWSNSLINTDKMDWGPRLGFAYDIFGKGKTIVRGGYGRFYYLDRGGVGNQLSNNPEFNGTSSYSASAGYRITFTGQSPLNSLDPTIATAPLPSATNTVNINDPQNVNVISFPKKSKNSQVQQWNLQVEQTLGANMSLNIAYVGTSMDHLATAYNANAQGNIISNLNTGGNNPTPKPYPNLGNVNTYAYIGSGTYNGLQTRLNRRMTKGLQFTAAYTWSHTMDDSVGAFSNSGGSVIIDAEGNPLLHLIKGNSDSDIRHYFVFSALYELPFGKGRQFGSDVPRALDYLIGGWQVSPIVTLSTGAPMNVYNGNGANHYNYNGGCSVVDKNHIWLSCSAGALTAPAAGQVGTLARNYFHGPGLHTFDMALSKNFVITERVGTEFRIEGFNLTNTPQFVNPDGNANNDDFGKLTQTRFSSERQIGLALRVHF